MDRQKITDQNFEIEELKRASIEQSNLSLIDKQRITDQNFEIEKLKSVSISLADTEVIKSKSTTYKTRK